MKKRKEILKKKWINLDLLKIHIPETLHEIIRKKYGVEVNSDSLEAKDSILGKPTFANFKTYSDKGSRKHSTKRRALNPANDYGTQQDTWASMEQNRSAQEANLKTKSVTPFKLADMRSEIQVSLNKGGRTVKSKRTRRIHDNSCESYFNNSVTKYLSPGKRNQKNHYTSQIESQSIKECDRYTSLNFTRIGS